jgi:hypothetical protein
MPWSGKRYWPRVSPSSYGGRGIRCERTGNDPDQAVSDVLKSDSNGPRSVQMDIPCHGSDIRGEGCVRHSAQTAPSGSAWADARHGGNTGDVALSGRPASMVVGGRGGRGTPRPRGGGPGLRGTDGRSSPCYAHVSDHPSCRLVLRHTGGGEVSPPGVLAPGGCTCRTRGGPAEAMGRT